MYTNADSLLNKVNDLKIVVDMFDTKPNKSILAITEVKAEQTKLQVNYSEFSLSGDNIIGNDMDSNPTSITLRIVVYINNMLDLSIIEWNKIFKELTVIKIKVDTNNVL